MSFRTSTTLPDNIPPGPESKDTPAKAVASEAVPSAHNVARSFGARSFAFPRASRVTRGADIEQIRKEGKRVRTASMEVRAIASLGVSGNVNVNAEVAPPIPIPIAPAQPRVGVVVPKYGKNSVQRNLLKRRLKELVRIEVLPVLQSGPAIDLVIKTAPRAYTRTFDELREEVRKWTQQLVTGRGGR